MSGYKKCALFRESLDPVIAYDYFIERPYLRNRGEERTVVFEVELLIAPGDEFDVRAAVIGIVCRAFGGDDAAQLAANVDIVDARAGREDGADKQLILLTTSSSFLLFN